MEEFRKNKKLSQEEKDEIIEYAKQHGVTSVKEKFGVWPETVRYWMRPDLRDKVKESQKRRHNAKKEDKAYKNRRDAYREMRQKTGLARQKHKEWRESLSEEEIQRRVNSIKQHRIENIERYKKKAKQRYLKEKEQGLHRKKYNEDPVHKMKCNIREHVRQAIKYSNISKSHPSIRYLGCSIEEFKKYIEDKFQEGMTWENHSRGEGCWHLDHIRPLAHLKDVTDVHLLKQICHYTNYQPLWEKDNLSKQDKYEG